MEIDAIQKLIETDEKTRSRIQTQYQKRSELKEAVETEKKKLSDEAWADAKKKVADRRQELNDRIATEEKANDAYYAKASAELKDTFEKNRERWCADLVKRITTTE